MKTQKIERLITAALFTATVLFTGALASAQGVMFTRATPRDVVPIVSQLQPGSGGFLIGTNNVIGAVSSNMFTSFSWQDVTPGNNVLALQASFSSSATNAGTAVVLIEPSIDGITPASTPTYSATFNLLANTNPVITQIVTVVTNMPGRKWTIIGIQNTATAGTITMTNFYPAFIPLQ